VERPDPSAMLSLVQELNQTLSNVADTQRKMLAVTGTAWSEDRMIKAVVGPRGQLVDLEIDPRVYRKPNSKALASTILSTVRAAVEQAVTKTQEIVDQSMPQVGDMLRPGPNPGLDMRRLIRSHDADLKKIVEEGDDVDLH
jgi:DNA-binding protein YbaB